MASGPPMTTTGSPQWRPDRFPRSCMVPAGSLARTAACAGATSLPTRNVRLRTVLACCAPLIGSSSDKRSATLPNGAMAAYRAVTSAARGRRHRHRSRVRQRSSPRLRPGTGRPTSAGPRPARRRTRSGTSPRSGPWRRAGARTLRKLAGRRLGRHLRRHHLGLQRLCDLLGLVQPQPELRPG